MEQMTAPQHPQQVFKIVSVGYEGHNIENFVEMLRLNEVNTVVDVRLYPISRKKGFSKTALSQALAEAGIGYRHERDLGNPKQNRDPFRQGLQSARKHYLEHIQNGASEVYNDVIGLAHETLIALLCYEREHHQCHRSCILELAEREYPGLSILKL